MKIYTYHRQVWLVGEDIKKAEIKNRSKRNKEYYCPSDYVAVIYSETNSTFELYIGYKAPHKKARGYILSLANSFDIKNIEIKRIERISDLKEWDKLVFNLNKILAN
jgi:hypothetical protein